MIDLLSQVPVPTRTLLIGPIVLLAALLLLGGLIMLCFRQTRFIGAICLALVMLPGVVLFFRASAVVSHVEMRAPSPPPPVLEVDPDILVDADAHPSIELAVNALVRRLERDIDEIVPNADAVSTIHYPWALHEALSEPMRESLKSAFEFAKLEAYSMNEVDREFLYTLHPEKKTDSALEREVEAAAIDLNQRRVKPSAQGVVLRIDFVPSAAKKDEKTALEGQLRLIAHGPNQKQVAYAVSLFSKPWAANPAGYASSATGADPVIAFSAPAATREQAISEARARAADEVYQRLEPQLAVRWQGRFDGGHTAAARASILAQVRDDTSDQFVQKLQLRHGDVAYRAGVLVNLDDHTREKLLESAIGQVHQSRSREKGTFLSIAGLAAVVLLLYFFLNAVTKGYFQFSLRAMTLLLLAVGIVVIMAMV